MKALLLTAILSLSLITTNRTPTDTGADPHPNRQATATADKPFVIERISLVSDMAELLWPDAEYNLLLGPEDEIYVCPTSDEIRDLFHFFIKFRSGFNYTPEAFDCDDFATEFKYWATIWNVRHYHSAHAALAVGKAYIKLNGYYDLLSRPRYVAPCGHVINVIRRSDGQWFFLEPQTGKMAPIESLLYEGTVEVVKIEI